MKNSNKQWGWKVILKSLTHYKLEEHIYKEKRSAVCKAEQAAGKSTQYEHREKVFKRWDELLTKKKKMRWVLMES